MQSTASCGGFPGLVHSTEWCSSSLSDVSFHVVVNRLVKHCQEEISIFHCDAHGRFDPECLWEGEKTEEGGYGTSEIRADTWNRDVDKADLCKQEYFFILVNSAVASGSCYFGYLSVDSPFAYQDPHVLDVLEDLIHGLRRQRVPAGL